MQVREGNNEPVEVSKVEETSESSKEVKTVKTVVSSRRKKKRRPWQPRERSRRFCGEFSSLTKVAKEIKKRSIRW